MEASDGGAARAGGNLFHLRNCGLEGMFVAMSQSITMASTVVATPEQISCDLKGEAVILNLSNGGYYGLNPVGARIWELIQEPRTVAEVQVALVDEYDVEPDRCASDLLTLIREMIDESLIEIRPAPEAPHDSAR